ncbi:MAG: carbon storage regulator [Lachnospiraceae bacterium]|nr:carbon storage regulator [Lachnospiraceae bacterium]
MLRMTVNTEEYLQIGDDIRIVFLGGSRNHTRVMLDIPKEVNVVRSKALEKRAASGDGRETSHYYAEPELPERYRKKKRAAVSDNTKKDTVR